MRTTSTKSFTIALVLTTLLTAPMFAARDDAKRQPREGDQQQQTVVQRLINKIVHIFDDIVITRPADSATTTT
ncbi:MAG TPA: hypothetical protein VHU41_10930 [Thermoanaerobaculia bacterium]|nr:hypothetical protein [Thermoanaerobaculia bacterium]